MKMSKHVRRCLRVTHVLLILQTQSSESGARPVRPCRVSGADRSAESCSYYSEECASPVRELENVKAPAGVTPANLAAPVAMAATAPASLPAAALTVEFKLDLQGAFPLQACT